MACAATPTPWTRWARAAWHASCAPTALRSACPRTPTWAIPRSATISWARAVFSTRAPSWLTRQSNAARSGTTRGRPSRATLQKTGGALHLIGLVSDGNVHFPRKAAVRPDRAGRRRGPCRGCMSTPCRTVATYPRPRRWCISTGWKTCWPALRETRQRLLDCVRRPDG